MKRLLIYILIIISWTSCHTSKVLQCENVQLELRQKAMLSDGQSVYDLLLSDYVKSDAIIDLELAGGRLINYMPEGDKVVKGDFKNNRISIPVFKNRDNDDTHTEGSFIIDGWATRLGLNYNLSSMNKEQEVSCGPVTITPYDFLAGEVINTTRQRIEKLPDIIFQDQWLHYREEDIGELRLYRPWRIKQPKPGWYKHRIKFIDDTQCEYLKLSPADAHMMEPATYSFESDDQRLRITDPKANKSYNYEIIRIEETYMLMKEL